jgi:hypothetical protein
VNLAKVDRDDLIDKIVARLDLSDLDDLADGDFGDDIEEVARTAAEGALDVVATAAGEDVLDLVDQVNEAAVKAAREQAADLVSQVTDTTRDMIRDVIADGLKNNIGLDAIADGIASSAAFSDARAKLIAWTEVADANSRAALEGYKVARDGYDLQVKKGWILGPNPCEICQENADVGPIDLDDVFPSGDTEPTAHPRAVFEGHSFAGYGETQQFLRARYDGPAVTIVARQVVIHQAAGQAGDNSNLAFFDVLEEQATSQVGTPFNLERRELSGESARLMRLTIGPNHPVLTRRGFVIASELHEGDELLYDERAKFSMPVVSESDFDKVPLIEDAFDAAISVFGKSRIPAPRLYFHGDEVACYGEVDVVRPTRDLLPKFDASIFKHINECDLTGAYTSAEHVATCGSCLLKFNRIFSAASSGMGGGNLSGTSLGSLDGPPPFQCFRVVTRHKTTFRGLAFDASTTDTVYAIGGFVVKNCECALVSYLASEGEDEEAEDEDEDEDANAEEAGEGDDNEVQQAARSRGLAKGVENEPRDERGRWTTGIVAHLVTEVDPDNNRVKVQSFPDRAAAEAEKDRRDDIRRYFEDPDYAPKHEESSYDEDKSPHGEVAVHSVPVTGEGDSKQAHVLSSVDQSGTATVHGVFANAGDAKVTRNAMLREKWKTEGRDLDWDHPSMLSRWDREEAAWNKTHPDRLIAEDRYTFGTYPEFDAHMDQIVRGKKEPYPGHGPANDYFREDGSHLQIVRVKVPTVSKTG